MDEMFDAAYNETVLAGDIPNIRWARIDYVNVTYLTTKWNVWRRVIHILFATLPTFHLVPHTW